MRRDPRYAERLTKNIEIKTNTSFRLFGPDSYRITDIRTKNKLIFPDFSDFTDFPD
jgi:predicted DNA-binding helix-hairpin-helix protein